MSTRPPPRKRDVGTGRFMVAWKRPDGCTEFRRFRIGEAEAARLEAMTKELEAAGYTRVSRTPNGVWSGKDKLVYTACDLSDLP